jgi:exodeoxyribonuclease VII large subunit
VLATSAWIVDSRAEDLSRYVSRGSELIELVIERSRTQVHQLTAQLRALSPQRTLSRGYSIAQLPDGTAIRSVTDAPGGTALTVTVADGKIAATVDPG